MLTYPGFDPVAVTIGPVTSFNYSLVFGLILLGGWLYALLRAPSKKEAALTMAGITLAGAALLYLMFYHPALGSPEKYFAIRWYALAYLGAFLFGWAYAVIWAKRNPFRPNAEDFDELVPFVVAGTVLGGRLGYILFYQLQHFIDHPLDAIKIWEGGMSFHGGLIGVVLTVIIFARLKKISILALGDLCCAATPIGLFLGRLANFVNGELWGRPADPNLPWSMVFPHVDAVPRHPSQLYEAGFEGIVLFTILFLLVRRADIRARPGIITGAFLIFYALARVTAELFREPDDFLGYFAGGITMGQILSIPMIAIGLILIIRAKRLPPYEGA